VSHTTTPSPLVGSNALITPCMAMALAADFGDLAGLNAAGADVNTSGCAVYHGANALDIWAPTTLGAHV
jgi:hypothetical protein